MGWHKNYLNETHDVMEFFRMFTARVCLENEGDALYNAYTRLLVGKTESITEGTASRVEEFFGKLVLLHTILTLILTYH